MSGAYRITKPLDGCHEIVAFLEGLLFARSHGFDYHQMVFYTDDQSVAYAQQLTCPGHVAFQLGDKDKFLEQLEQICIGLYTSELFEIAQECILKARFHKVRSHHGRSGSIYNNRVDYLARNAMYEKRGIPQETLSFEVWLEETLISFSNSIGLAFLKDEYAEASI